MKTDWKKKPIKLCAWDKKKKKEGTLIHNC